MYAITKTVKKHRLTEVKQLQALLHILGHPIAVDGMLDNNTQQEIEKFHKKHNITEGNSINRQSWLILYNTFNHFMHQLCNDSITLDTRGCQLFKTEQSPFITIDSSTDNTGIVTWLQVLLYVLDNNTRITGIFDDITADKIKKIQQKHNIIADGKVNDATWQVLFNEGANTADIVAKLFLSDHSIKRKAEQENIDIAILKAVIKVESNGCGFYSGCHPKMLFEGHKFWKQLEQLDIDPNILQKNNKDILYPKWTTTFYTGSGQGEYKRLEKAKIIDEEAALNSASWGMFHLMGSDATACGFDDVTSFISSISAGENRQLDAFVDLLHHQELFQLLKNQDWATFASRYNGAKFRKNGYDAKLQIAFDVTRRRTCSTRGESSDAVIVDEYTRWLEEAYVEFSKTHSADSLST
jgi:hypothetical protein